MGAGSASRSRTRAAPAQWTVSAWEWAPDDTSILGTPADANGTILNQVLLDSGGRHVTDAVLGERRRTHLATSRALTEPTTPSLNDAGGLVPDLAARASPAHAYPVASAGVLG